MAEHCCDLMDEYLGHEDSFVDYVPKFREYGIPVRDGGGSHIVISFCPWCGANLPASLREKWFAELQTLGHADPLDEGYPTEFQTDQWWKTRELK